MPSQGKTKSKTNCIRTTKKKGPIGKQWNKENSEQHSTNTTKAFEEKNTSNVFYQPNTFTTVKPKFLILSFSNTKEASARNCRLRNSIFDRVTLKKIQTSTQTDRASNQNKEALIEEKQDNEAVKPTQIREQRIFIKSNVHLQQMLKLIQSLLHPNLVKIQSFQTVEDMGKVVHLNVKMQALPCTLAEFIQKQHQNTGKISLRHLKMIAKQLFEGLLYLQSKGLVHINLTPQNILIDEDEERLILVISDIGSLKSLSLNQLNHFNSPSYRAPELILGNLKYATSTHMWAAGCILFEMANILPLFEPSFTSLDQFVKIVCRLGWPSKEEILQINPESKLNSSYFPKDKFTPFEKVLKRDDLGIEFYSLLRRIMSWSPKSRCTPNQALSHPFFATNTLTP